MRILLAARHSPVGDKPVGGVQSWNKTVGKELGARGHEVYYWEPRLPLKGAFDLGIIANYVDTKEAMKFCRDNVSISHGIIAPEKPFSRNAMFTSEEVRDHWNSDGPVLRQPIDLEFWKPTPTLAKVNLTRFSYRCGLPFVPQLAQELKLKYKHVSNLPPRAVLGILRRSACVLATGRAAVEAMACGVPVVICDHRSSYQEPLMDVAIEHAMHHNYSGRGGVEPNPGNVMLAIKAAIQRGSLRKHAEEHHNCKKIVDQLLGYVK